MDMNFFAKMVFRLVAPHMFGKMLVQCEKSAAYGRYCEMVYGKNLCQFNMLDYEQLRKMLDLAEMDQHSQVLDLGCAVGNISEYISDQTKAAVTGIDFAGVAVKRAVSRTINNKKLTFKKMNMNQLKFEQESFTHIISIDTLYFVENLENTVAKMKNLLKPGGRMAIFYGAPGKYDSKPLPEETPLGKALSASSLKFSTVDFTEAEIKIWEKSLTALEQLKEDFEQEKNHRIYSGRLRESTNLLEHHKQYPGYRYLYMVSK